jgi:hypothetical protein
VDVLASATARCSRLTCPGIDPTPARLTRRSRTDAARRYAARIWSRYTASRIWWTSAPAPHLPAEPAVVALQRADVLAAWRCRTVPS